MRQMPSKEPKFHHAEILDGAGRSMKDPLMIFTKG